MRVVKYRAWDKWKKEMIPVAGIDFTNEFIWVNELIDDETSADTRYFDEVILLERTGLKDKNGVEVYEGDILSVYEVNGVNQRIVENRYVSKVEWKDFGFIVTEDNDTEVPLLILDGSRDWIGSEVEIEVIGDVYNNPEL